MVPYADDFLGPRLSGEHGENARPAADVQHDLVLEEIGVVEDGRLVFARAHFILQHLLMDAWLGMTVRSGKKKACPPIDPLHVSIHQK